MISFSPSGRGPGYKDVGFKHNPFLALVVPRPIGWISSVSAAGIVNLAPYSFFNGISVRPPMVMYASNDFHEQDKGEKDTVRNIRQTRQFVVNLATFAQQTEMNNSSASAPRDVDEFEAVGLEKLPGQFVNVPRVKGAPVHLECELIQFVDLTDGGRDQGPIVTLGRVVGIHIDEALIDDDGTVDITRARPMARLGYFLYCSVDETFEIARPTWPLGGKADYDVA